MGDMTVHGGSVVVGFPMVLIGGQPAARVGDMHVCPMVTPGVPPIPHVGGPVMPPGAVTVLIGGQPAACVGDMATCTGPPDSIAPPGCPTVLIAQGGGGGGGGGAGSGGEASLDTGSAAEAAEPGESHFLDVKVVDKGGFPITGLKYSIKTPDNRTETGLLTGKIKRSGTEEGDHEISLRGIVDAQWSAKNAKVGDKVKMTAKTVGIESGEKAELRIFIKDSNFADRQFETIKTKVESDKIEEEWELQVDEKLVKDQDGKKSKNYSSPSFYFVATVAGIQQRSGSLKYKDWIEIEARDDDDQPISRAKYTAYLPNGSVKKGNLDRDGYAKLEDVPPGKVDVSVDVRDGSE
jgi:uncharacterized Zn-binding protein involved in type VI secretion